MLDLKMLIPEEISGTHIESEISRDQIRISGRYRNHRRFSLNLNRFIDEPLFYFGCGLFAGERTKGGKGTPFEFANSNPMIKEDDAIAPATRDSEIHDFPESAIEGQ